MRIRSLTCCLLAISSLGAQRVPFRMPALYETPPFHSQVQFVVPFMGLSSVRGGFDDFTGAMFIDPSKPESSAVTFLIETESIHTGVALRDKHLKSSDFFDVTRFPVILFQSDRVTPARSGYTVYGRLTLHGVTKAIALPVTLRHEPMHDANGLDYAGFDAELTLNWRDFGIAATNAQNSWFQPATMLVNDSVRVSLSIEAEHRAKFNRATVALTRAAYDSTAAELMRRAQVRPQ
jgi:polyisoprenoid-binding protein YceI